MNNEEIQTRRVRGISRLMPHLALATTLLLGAAGGASASLVTYDFSGGTGADAFTGSFSFDTDNYDNYADPRAGYYMAGAPFPMSYSFSSAQGSFSGSSTYGNVTVDNNLDGQDYFQLLLVNYSVLLITLTDPTQTAFSSDALPTHMSLDQFTASTVYAADETGRDLVTNAALTSLVNAVPEPSSIALVLAGLGSLVGATRLRRRQRRDGLPSGA